MKITHTVLLTCISVAWCVGAHCTSLAQSLTADDFQIGVFRLGSPYDSISATLGKPDSVEDPGAEWGAFTGHYYPKLVIWTNRNDRKIWTLDIYDSSLTTHRGLKIGDTVAKIDKLYPTEPIYTYQDKFRRVGPYDVRFRNYSEYRLYEFDPSENEGWVLILFTQKGFLTKILYYIGVPE